MLGDVCYSGKNFMIGLIRPTVVATGEPICWLRPDLLGLGSAETSRRDHSVQVGTSHS